MQRDARRRAGVRLQISFSAAASAPLRVLQAGPAAAAPVKRSIVRVCPGVLISEGARHIPRAGEGLARVSRCAGGSQGQDRRWRQEEGGWHRWVLQNWEHIPVSCSAERGIPEAFLFWTLSETRRLETDPSSRAPSKLQAPPEQSFLPLSWPPCEGWPLSAVGPGRTGRPLSRSSPVCDVTVAPDAPPCVPVCMASVVGFSTH